MAWKIGLKQLALERHETRTGISHGSTTSQSKVIQHTNTHAHHHHRPRGLRTTRNSWPEQEAVATDAWGWQAETTRTLPERTCGLLPPHLKRDGRGSIKHHGQHRGLLSPHCGAGGAFVIRRRRIVCDERHDGHTLAGSRERVATQMASPTSLVKLTDHSQLFRSLELVQHTPLFLSPDTHTHTRAPTHTQPQKLAQTPHFPPLLTSLRLLLGAEPRLSESPTTSTT